ILMDMCGLKGQMVVDMTNLCNAYGLYYIGTHPMAGREKSGYYASLPNLFQGANFIITPTEGTNQQAADTVIALAKAMGFGKIVSTSPYRHDTMIAYTSQLAHVVSSAYVKDDCMDDALDFSGGSFQDMTRVATMDEYMWSALFLDNRVELLRHLDMLLKNLIQYRDALQLRDEAALQKLILDGRLIQEENVRKRAKRKEQQG
ncbi:MAG: prephenate dehydrogenase, partial [Ruminococcus sp.]